MYNTATDALMGILWLMILFAFLAAVAVAFYHGGRRSGGCCRSGKRFAAVGPSKPVET